MVDAGVQANLDVATCSSVALWWQVVAELFGGVWGSISLRWAADDAEPLAAGCTCIVCAHLGFRV
jgi:hypothetical protein